MKRHAFLLLIFYSGILILQSCTEPFTPKTETFEDLLVMEATITNELKTQEIKLTRTNTFEASEPEIVTDAEVTVSDNSGNEYIFEYNEGKNRYLSVMQFQAKQNWEYTLHITTKSGESFISSPEILPTDVQVNIETAKKKVDGKKGVQISVSSYDPSNSSHYYRYEYQETFKIIAPYWSAFKAISYPSAQSPISGYLISYEVRDNLDTRICYSTKHSDEIMLTNTTSYSEDRVTDFPIRFIGPDNPILTHKYSILVTQYIESYESYVFYKTLKKMAGTDGSLLSPNQPGFIVGNMSAVNNPDKKIIGYFDVVSVSSERIFLERDAVFPDAPTPPYFQECEIEKLDIRRPLSPKDPRPDHYKMLRYIRNNNYLLYKVIKPLEKIYWMVPAACSDCTTFASNKKPEFWP